MSPSQVATEIQASDTPATAAAKLQLEFESVILLLGDFDAALQPKTRSILSRVVAPLAVDSRALIIDNGAGSGSAAAMSLAIRDQDRAPQHVAILARDAAFASPEYQRVVRLPAEWPDTIKATFQITNQLVNGPDETATAASAPVKDQQAKVKPAVKPVLAILFGGTDADFPSLIQCARRQWPVVLMQESGGLADRIIAAVAKPADGTAAAPIADPAMAEIAETASLTQVSMSAPTGTLERILVAHLEARVLTLADAWARFDDLDGAAVIRQASFRLNQGALLMLGVFATLLAISMADAKLAAWLGGHLPASLLNQPWGKYAHYLMIVTPIAISILVAANSRFREGNKWILLRSAAESIKREIYRYRAQAGDYSAQAGGEISREARLATKIKDITSNLLQSEVNKTNLQHAPKDFPKRMTLLSPEEYVSERLEDQIGFMVKKTARLNGQLQRTQISILLAGGAGTLLAAIGGDVWVALTTALATALTTKLESEQVENSLVQYNQALTSLLNIRTWWKALSDWEKGRRANIDLLVEKTEQTMEFELSGWVQQMQSALDKLTEKEASSGAGKSGGGAA